MKNKKGITLIALIITIIVMLILVGVTVSAVIKGGLFSKTKEAAKRMQIEEDREVLQAAVYAAMNVEMKIEKAQDLRDNLPSEWQVTEKGKGIYICISPSSNAFEVTEDGRITYIESLQDIGFNILEVQDVVLSETENVVVIDEYGNDVKVPAGFKITKDAANVVDGIVIEDCTEKATKGSQFVWIPVGEIKIDSEGTTVDNPLERYSGTEDTKYGSGAITIGETIYNYKANVNTAETEEFELSVESNGGYYIGRYEARAADGQRGSADKSVAATDVLTCKASDYLYNYVNYSDALRLSKEMYKGTSFSSNLVNSYAWDTALEYFETVTDAKTYSEKISVNQGSEDGKVNFCWKGTAGTENEDKICNVYDMASNSYEWSTEVHIEGKANIARGGVYSSAERKAGSREICDVATEGFHTLTFRVILYLDENKGIEEETEIPTLADGNILAGNYIKKVGDTKVVIPKGFGIVNTTGSEEKILSSIEEYDTYITETNISNGIVVKDAEGNEFVWIPVNDINSMIMCQNAKENETCTIKLKGDTLKCTKHNSEALAGKLYATATGNNFDANLTGQTYSTTTSFREPVGLSDSDTQEFNNMAISVAKNGGFYVGRYETGGFNETKVESKKGNGTGARGDINSTTWDVMYQKQKAFGNNTVGSSMIWGCQYDQVMKFVDGKNGFNVKEADSSNRHSGSSTTGTGNTPADFAANIYDLEDNMCEWTMESYNGTSRVMRGGGYKNSKPASNRTGHGPTNSNSDVGSRMTLYIKTEEKIEPPELPDVELPTGWTVTTTPTTWTKSDGVINDKVIAIKDGNNNIVPLPEGYSLSEVEGEYTVSEGLVITDGENEFVWIPVPEETVFESTYTPGYSEPTYLKNNDTATKAPYDSQATIDYYYGKKEDGSSYYTIDIDSAGTNGLATNTTTSNGTTFDYGYHYNEMVASVNKYNGFYVGRYETTIDENRIGSKEGATVLLSEQSISQTNNKPLRWWGFYDVQRNSDVKGNGTIVQTNMAWGRQWEAIITFFGNKDYGTSSLGTLSTTGEQNAGQAKYTYNNEIMSDKICNIYDLRGNVYEWTAAAARSEKRGYHGGCYPDLSSASFHAFLYPEETSGLGSRLTLYIK